MVLRLERLPNARGIGPDNELKPKCLKNTKLIKIIIKFSTLISIFYDSHDTYNPSRDDKFPKDEGIEPVR